MGIVINYKDPVIKQRVCIIESKGPRGIFRGSREFLSSP